MNKNPEGFGLGAPPRDLTEYANRKRYTYVENHALRGLFLACGNRHQYYNSAMFFCDTFDRWAAAVRKDFVEKGRRVPTDVAVFHADHVLHRKMWGMVTKYNSTPDPIYGDFSREGLPLSYREGYYIKLWRDTKIEKRGSMQDLATVLGRRTTDLIEGCCPKGIMEDRDTYDPTTDPDALRAALRAFAAAGDTTLEDYNGGVEALLVAWKNLDAIIRGRV